MRADDGDAAGALLALLRPDLDYDNEREVVRAYVGAGLLVDALADLKLLRKAWTETK